MTHLRLALAVSFLALTFAPNVRADLNVNTLGTPVVVTFDSTLSGVNMGEFTGKGIGSGNGRLLTGSWAFTGNGSDGPSSNGSLSFSQSDTDGDFGRGDGGQENVSNPGLWSFNVNNDSSKKATVNRALGVYQGNNNFTPGTITLRVKNNIAPSVTAMFWAISYDLFTYNNTNSSSSITFSYSTDDVNYTSVSALDFASLTTIDPSVTVGGVTDWSAANNKSTTLSVSVPSMGNLYLRWTFDDAVLVSGRDQLAIDNISVAAVVPEPRALLLGGVVCGAVGLSIAWRKMWASGDMAPS